MAMIEIPDEQLRAAGTNALLASLTPEQKEKLIEGAIANLMEKEFTTSRWSNMQAIFNRSVEHAATTLVEEELRKPERLEQLGKIVSTALDKLWLDDKRFESIASKIASDIGEAMFGKRY